MKKLLAIFAFVLLGMTYAQAQQVSDVPESLTETMIKKLELNEEQLASVNKILSVMQPAMQSLKNSDLNNSDNMRKLMNYADREKLNMKNILTDVQFTKYLKFTGRI